MKPEYILNHFEDDARYGVMAMPNDRWSKWRMWFGLPFMLFGLWIAGIRFDVRDKEL